MNWKWGEGPYLEKYYPWEYPQLDFLHTISPEEIWNKKRKISAYIHIPFCKEKCDYCNYRSFPGAKKENIINYLQSLKNEILIYSQIAYLRESTISNLSIGGGTPSLLNITQIHDLINYLRERFTIENCELSIEVHPTSINNEKLQILKEVGVNRISIGIQSFDDSVLREMGRPYSGKEAFKAVLLIQKIPFPNINLDLIYGYPSQSLAMWEDSVMKAIDLGPERITCSSISIHPGTLLYYKIKKLALPKVDADTEIKMMELAIDRITKAGYTPLTMLSFSKDKGIYNLQQEVLRYGGELLGLGLSSFSVIKQYVYVNTFCFDEYLRRCSNFRLPIIKGSFITRKLEMSMAVIHSLKTLGINKNAFKQRFGVEIDDIFGDTLKKLEKKEFIIINNNSTIKLSIKGLVYMGQICREFYLYPPVFPKDFKELYKIDF